MANAVLSNVLQVDLNDGELTITIKPGYFDPGERVEIWGEISGEQTDKSAVFAPFHDIQNVPTDGNLVVTVKPVDSTKFEATDPVTVAVRVAKPWVTLLTLSKKVGIGSGSATWVAGPTATL